jgi:putative flippase GtrA
VGITVRSVLSRRITFYNHDNPVRQRTFAFTQRAIGGTLGGAVICSILLYYIAFHTPVQFYLYGVIGISVCVISGYLISFIGPGHAKSLVGLTYYTLGRKSN